MRTFHLRTKDEGLLFWRLKKSLYQIYHLKDRLSQRLHLLTSRPKGKAKSGLNWLHLILKLAPTGSKIFVHFFIFFWLSFILKSSAMAQPISEQPPSDPKPPNISPSAKISLEQAISDAWEKNLPLANLRLEARSLAVEEQKTLKQKLFTLRAAGNYLYKSQTIFLELPPLSPAATSISPFRIEGGFRHNYDLSLAIAQPIFTGGRLSTQASLYRSAEEATSLRAILLAQEIASHLKLLYFEHHRLQAKKNSLLAFKEQLHLHEKKMASLVEEGLARRLSLLETKMKIEEAAASLLDLEQALTAIKADFQHLCGHSLEEIQEDFEEPELKWEEAIDFFEKHHPQFQIYEEKLNQVRLQKRIVQANNLPQIAAVAEVHYGRPGLNFFKREWSLYATAGLAIQFRLFDWFQDRSEMEKLNLEEQKIVNEKENFIEEIKQELKKLYEQKELLTQKLAHLENIIRLAEEEVKLKEELARENLLPHLDYLSSLQAFEQNKWAKEEIRLAREEIKVKINSLVARKEDKY